MRHSTYTLRIESDGGTLAAEDMEALQRAVSDAEAVISNRLPEGFYCKIDETGEGVDLAAVRALEAMGDA